MTGQEVIRSFFKQLANHGYANSDTIGANMLDSAVRASSRYSGIQAVIEAMKADQIKAEKEAVEEILGTDYADKTISEVPSNILSGDAKDYDPENKSNAYYNETNDNRSTVENLIKERKAEIFLEKYCGILLNKKFWFDSSGTAKTWGVLTDSVDTGAITGSDAGGSTPKTAQSVVPEIFINTYIASTSTAQNIITNDRDWVIKATAANDTITSNGADSINAGAGNDKIIANAGGATITSGNGKDSVTVSESVNDITLSDLNSYDTLKIKGTFEVGTAQIEDGLLVVTDKTGTRKIRLGDLDNAKSAKINSTTIGAWLTNAGVDLNNLKTINYSDDKVVESTNVANNSTDTAITVDLNNVDTSAADNVTIDGAQVGSLSSTFPNASTFTRNGLTIHLLGVSNSTSGSTSNIVKKTLDELTEDERTIVAGLFKWWVGASLKLSEESYGIGFNSPTAMIKDMGLFFYDSNGSNNTLAASPYWPRSADGAITQLMLKINMNYFKNISSDNVDGASSAVSNLLDRTLAHELTHSNMETNINYFVELPQFIIEGAAELVHGIDDERGNRIFTIAADSSTLNTVLDVSNKGTGNANYYAGGYMFLRYFAKHAAEETLPAFGEITATVNLNRNGNYYISGNSTSETASSTAQAIKLGTVSKGVYTVENTGVHQVINNTNNMKIVGLTVNDTLIGSDSADIVETSEGSFITTGKGADSIKINGQFATIDAGAGDDTIIAENGGHHSVNLGDGNNFIKFNQSSTYADTVKGGAGNDTISINRSAYDSSICAGAGNDSVYIGGQNNTIEAGDGNDIIKFRYEDDNENYIELGAGNDKATILGEKNTIDGGAGNDTIFVGEHVTSFNVADFSVGDVIQLNATIDNLERIDGGLTAGKVTIGGLSNLSTTSKEWTLVDNVATHSNKISEGAILSEDKKSIAYTAASEESIVAVSGVKSTDGLAIDTANKIVTVNSAALNELNVTISDGYNLALGEVETPTTQEAAWNLRGTTAIYSASATTAGYTLANNQINYVAAKGGASLVTISGIKSTDGLAIDTANKIVTVNSAALNELNVTISDGYKLALGNVETPTTQEAAWNLRGTTAIYSASATTAGYTLANNQINYVAAKGGETLIELDGIASAPTLKGDTVTLSKKNFAEDISIVEGGGNKFKLRGGSYSGKTFNGSADADNIVSKGMSLTLNGGAGNDTLTSGSNNNLLNGEEGDDILIGGTGRDTFAYSGGKDTITNYATKDKISIASAYENFAVSGSDVIFNFADDSLTIKNGAGKKITFLNGKNKTSNFYTTAGIFDDKKESVTLSAPAENFTADFRLKTIDGSATDSISMVGNSKSNVIYAGTGGSTMTGGKGKDTLYGGTGADIFVYGKGDGKDVIENYGAGDVISLNSGATIKSFEMKKADAIIKIGSGSLTVKDTSEFTFVENGETKIFKSGNITDGEGISVTLSSSYRGTFELGNYKTVDVSLTRKVKLMGNDKDNYLIGGKGKDSLTGGAGNDTLWGGKKNDTLTGGEGSDIFICRAGDGNDVIADYQSGDLLQILDKKGNASPFKKATFKDDTLTLKIKGGGKVILDNVGASTEFNINGDSYHISGNSLDK